MEIITIIGYLGSLFFIIGSGEKKRINYLVYFLIKDLLQLIYYIGINDNLVSFVTSLYLVIEIYVIYSHYKPNKIENILNKYSPWVIGIFTLFFDFSYNGLLIAIASILFGFSLITKELNSKYILLISNTIWISYGIFYQINPLILLCILVYINIIKSIIKIKKHENIHPNYNKY